MASDKRIRVTVSDDFREKIEEQINKEGKTVSTWGVEAFKLKLQRPSNVNIQSAVMLKRAIETLQEKVIKLKIQNKIMHNDKQEEYTLLYRELQNIKEAIKG